MTEETHPLLPFLPSGGKMLFLGSFPPPKARWSMDFFYPNWINDFWRIQGLIHFSDKHHFEVPGEKRFDRQHIVDFANEKGLAFFDVATKVKRLKDNASDDFLEILIPTDVEALLEKMPMCNMVITTGGKASGELQRQLAEAMSLPDGKALPAPRVGDYVECEAFGRKLRWWRMPSSSRAYPLALEKKAEFYKKLFV